MMRKSAGISALPKILSVLLVFVVAAAILSVPRYGQNSDGGGGTAGYFVYAEDDTGAGLQNSPDYEDEPSVWAGAEVAAAIREGLVPDALQCDYRKPITRAEIAELIPMYIIWHFAEGTTFEDYCEAFENGGALPRYYGSRAPEYRENVFSDTNDETLNRLYELGLISGYEDGTYRGDEPVSRQEAAVILYGAEDLFIEYWAQLSYGTSFICKEFLPGRFRDFSSIGEWAAVSVGRMVLIGCMNGVSEDLFAPRELISREQAIITVWRMAQSDGMGEELLAYREKDSLETVSASECTRIKVTDIGTGKYAETSDRNTISSLSDNLSSLSGYYTGISPQKRTDGYVLDFFFYGAGGAEYKTSLYVSADGSKIDVSSAETGAEDESISCGYQAYSNSKQFNVTGGGNGISGADVKLLRNLIDAA